MMKKNSKLIAILTNHEDDIYCFRKEVIEDLIKSGYQILVSCPYGEKLKLMESINLIFVDIKIDRRGTNLWKDIVLVKDYFALFRKYKPAVVLTFTIKPNIYGSIVASVMNIPYINNITGFGSIIEKAGLIKKLVMTLLKIALYKSSNVFFQNKDNMTFAIKEGIVKGQYMLIPGSGVNTERFSLLPYPEASEKVIFNYIGRILKEKGIDDYIEAAKKIKSVYTNTEFNIIGFVEPTELHYIEEFKLLQEKDIILYRGNQTDIRPFIERSHCTIHPSRYGEGMSNVLLESASSGRPVITTDISGCKEILEDNITGYKYHAGNKEELVEKISKFMALDNETRERMGELGRNKVMKDFSRELVINAYKDRILSLYE